MIAVVVIVEDGCMRVRVRERCCRRRRGRGESELTRRSRRLLTGLRPASPD